MRSKSILAAAAVASVALAIGSTANAANLVSNGDFESSSYSQSSQFGGTGVIAFGGQGVTDWTGISGLTEWFKSGTQSTVDALNHWNDPKDYFANFVTASPNGGSFVAIDGDPAARGAITQMVGGLVVGQKYTLTFDWAAAQLLNRSFPYTEQLEVMFGSDSAFAPAAPLSEGAQGFSGWKSVTMGFTASSTSELLEFMSIGTPNGQPPMALLDSVVLTPNLGKGGGPGIPEPATWAMMIIGLGSVGAAMRRRNRMIAAV